MAHSLLFFFFFFNDRAPTEFYPLPLPDALPICASLELDEALQAAYGYGHHLETGGVFERFTADATDLVRLTRYPVDIPLTLSFNEAARSEEHTSELQSQSNLVCRLLLEKKKNNN